MSDDVYFAKTISLIKEAEKIAGTRHSELATRYVEDKQVIRVEWYRGSLLSCLALEIPPPRDDIYEGHKFSKRIIDFFTAERGNWGSGIKT